MPSALVTVLCTSHDPSDGRTVLQEEDILVEATYNQDPEEAKDNAIDILGSDPRYTHYDTFNAWDLQSVERGGAE